MTQSFPKVKIPWKSLTPAQRKRLRIDPQLYGLPEYEAVKAARTSLPHDRAVERCAYLSQSGRRQIFPGAPMVDHRDIIRHLQLKKIPFVLTGMHGISSWIGRVRGTHDVDILVKGGRNFGRAVKAMRELYPELIMRDFTGLVGFFAINEPDSLIDVVYPHRADIQATLESAVWVEDDDLRYRIPILEAALANKYGASISIQRDAGKRGQDMIDFYQMVKHSMDQGRTPINLKLLEELGAKVNAKGGKEILHLVEVAKAGQVPVVEV